MRRLSFLLIFFVATSSFAASRLSRDAARKRIAELLENKLPSDAIEIRKIISTSASQEIAEATITLAFQFKKNDAGMWTVDSIRLGDRDWLNMTEFLAAIYHDAPPAPSAPATSTAPRAVARTDKFHVNSSDFEKQRRSMIELGASPLIPDAIDIRRVISQNDVRAIAECTVAMDFRFAPDSKSAWKIEAARLHNRDWVNTVDLLATLNEGRRRDTNGMMQKLATAIELYRTKNGKYPVVKDVVELNDMLHPGYAFEIVRLDAWGEPLEYNASETAFRLASKGPDGRWGTTDDIVVDGNSSKRP